MYKPVHAEYAAIGWKKKKEKFAESHREELDAYNAAVRYFKANPKRSAYSYKDLEAERKQHAAILSGQRKELEAVQADIKILRDAERSSWTPRGKLKGNAADFNKVQESLDFLRSKEIVTVESLDCCLDEISGKAVSIWDGMKKEEKRIKAVDITLTYIEKYETYKPVHAEYAAIGWKKKKEKFAENHREELDAYNAAVRYFKAKPKRDACSYKDLEAERKLLGAALSEQREELESVLADVKILRDVRHWINRVLPPEQYRQTAEPGKKPSVQESLKGRQERIRQEQAEKCQPSRTQKQQDMKL